MTGVEQELPRTESVPGQQDLPYWADDTSTLILGDAAAVLGRLPDASVDCVVTSPPYFGLRDYGVDGQIGLEQDPADYVAALAAVFAEVARVLVPTGTVWLNLGDTYSGRANGGPSRGRHRGHGHANGYPTVHNRTAHAPYKSLMGIPWRVAFALMDYGWVVRNDVAWAKPNAMPESVADRLSAKHERLFLLTRSDRYDFDLDAIRVPHTMRPQRRPSGRPVDQTPRPGGQPRQAWSTAARDEIGVDGHPMGANPGDVWSIPTTPSRREHYAAFPVEIPRRCIAAGCPEGGTVLDPFSGTGTTGEAARRLGRRYIGVDISAKYLDIQVNRFAQAVIA